MKRTIITAAVLALGITGAGVSLADPGPNGHNNHGLCTAYFAGSDNGQAHKHNANPFVALQEEAGDADGDGTPGTPSDVATYCMPYLSGNGNGNGNNGNPNANAGGKGGAG